MPKLRCSCGNDGSKEKDYFLMSRTVIYVVDGDGVEKGEKVQGETQPKGSTLNAYYCGRCGKPIKMGIEK